MNLNELLNQDKKLITTRYFEMQKAAEDIYGPNTVIFIEIGSFYEIYQYGETGKAAVISKELNIILTKKNKNLPEESESNPYLCGIPSVSLDKYIDVLANTQWTIIIVSQDGAPPNITRTISKIISPGTNVDYLKTEDYNFIASVFIEKNKDDIIYAGLSMIDLGTGKVLSFENYGTKNDKELAIDEIVDILRINNCRELILFQEGFKDPEALKDKVSLNNKISCTLKKISKNSLNINYQNELLKSIFNIESFLMPIEELDMERTPNALNALTLLIEFVSEHNMKIITQLKRPISVKNNKFLFLGNNALEQLNIVNDSNKNSLMNIVNNGCSAIGKRFISDQLKNPLIDKKEITQRYQLSEYFKDKKLRESLRMHLKSIYDIERLWRKIQLLTVNPAELHNFYSSINEIHKISEIMENNAISRELFGLTGPGVVDNIKSFINNIQQNFDLDKLAVFNMTNITSAFVKEGTSQKIDNMNNSLKEVFIKINKRGFELSKIFNNNVTVLSLDEDPRNVKIEGVNIGFNDTEGFFYEISKSKIKIFENKVQNDFNDYFEFEGVDLDESDNNFTTIKALKGSIKFYFKDVLELSSSAYTLESRLINLNKEFFLDFVSKIILNTEKIVYFVSYLEFMINNAILEDKFKYCKPVIVDVEDSFIEAVQLRHPVIEQIQTEIFIPNNIALGKRENCAHADLMENIFQGTEETTGIMLYGLNSAGKSTAMKSLGISIILAQAGFYVPATEFRYTIFENIFTRITGSDNIYKGLSTFAIEMMELKNIFNRANNKTLVLGDEIAHGTETVSALSIVASAVIRLIEIKSIFIFATHLHQLKDIKDVQDESTIKSMHIDVEYHEDTGNLIYNRTMLPGQGSSIYGLEFAKFMQMDKVFLTRAHQIRKEVSSKLDGIELLTNKKRSLYNKDKFLGKCELCNESADEVHHIVPQRDADEKGMIEHFSKDHKANLLSVCHECHMDIEHGNVVVLGKKMTGTGLKVILKDGA